MKKKTLLILTFLLSLVLTISAGAAFDVSERARIGLKYGSSAAKNPDADSTTGSFDFHLVSENISTLGAYNAKTVKVRALNSYLVVEQSWFETLDAAFSYCKDKEGIHPYFKEGVIYAVHDELYTEADALGKLEAAKLINETAYIINPEENLIKVYNENDKGILLFSQNEKEKLGISASEGGLMDFKNQNTYRDIIEFIKKGEVFELINNLTMQHYLYSVVPAEIGASAPLEAQKAQAVCARTYYEENKGRHKADGFALCPTTHCQMYIGTKWEREQSSRAVDETKNQIITYNNKPISAVYFAHSGGYTANVENVWGTPFPYLKSVEDKYCTDYTWETELDYDALTKKMEAYGYDIGTVTSVKIAEKSQEGLVTKLVISGTKGSKEFLREKARTILGLKSQNFTIPSKDIMASVKTAKGTKSAVVSKILTKDGITEVSESVSMIDGNKKLSTLTAKSGDIIYGKGYGHHVGLSQHGAMEYAEEGWDYIKILKHYYQGVEIEGE